MWPFRRRTDDDFHAEIDAHLALETDRLIAEGLGPEEARHAAARRFGNVVRAQERFHESRRMVWVDQSGQDVRYALRSLRRRPVFAAAAILTLAFGIGANAALFTVTRAVLLKSLPVERPEQLVEIGCVNPMNPEDACRTHYPGFLLFRERTDVLAGAFAFAPTGDLAANVDGRAEVITGLFLSGNAYAVLGLPPHAGRLLTPADDEPGAPAVAVLSYHFWQRRFGEDRAAIGRTLRLNNHVVTIVGVTPTAFRGLTLGMAPEVMLPIRTAETFRRPGSLQAPAAWWLYVFGRLKPGTTAEQAQVALASTFHDAMRMTLDALPANHGLRDFVAGFSLRVSSAETGGISGFRQTFEQPLQILWLVVSLVLLIACANLGGLLGSRALERRREFGVRMALGAGRGRLVRQVCTESLILAVAGGILALAIAGWAASAALVLGVGELGLRSIDVRPDTNVLAFTASMTLAIGVLIGIGSVSRIARTDLTEAWRASVSVGSRALVARTLLASQIAVAMVLVVTAVLFVRSLANARSVDPGFESERLVTFTVAPAMAGYTPDSGIRYLQHVLAAMEGVPGVRLGTYHAVPIATGVVSQTTVSVPGFVAPAEEMLTGQNRVGPWFAETLGLRVIAGRDLGPGDEASSSAPALVNEQFARHFYRDLDVVGRTFLVGDQEYSIVGVVADIHDRSVVQPPERWMYIPAVVAEPRMRVTVQTERRGLQLALEKTVQSVDPAVPLWGVTPIDAQIAETLRRERMLAVLGTAFGAVALGLVAIGVYAMFSGLVSRRAREIAIRMAIGSDHIRIAQLLGREALTLTSSGLSVGIAGAIALGTIVRTQLFNIDSTDSRAFATAVAVIALVVIVAVWVPARRATRIQPAQVLRAE